MDFYKTMLESLYEGIYFVDKERRISFWNKGAEAITGFSPKEVMGHFCHENILNHVDADGNRLCIQGCPLEITLGDGSVRQHELYLHHKDGHRVKISTRVTPIIEEGKIIGAVEVFTDLSNKELLFDPEHIGNYSVDELKLIALYDQLTTVPNRRYLESFLESRMRDYKTLGIEFGVLFMDIDHFRDFNNTYGHELGDRVLKMVAKTYASGVRKNDLIGRWGGEEFVGIFTGVSLEDMALIGEKLRMLVEASEVREREDALHVTISVGGTVVHPDDTVETILKRADMCMYDSKEGGRNRVTVG